MEKLDRDDKNMTRLPVLDKIKAALSILPSMTGVGNGVLQKKSEFYWKNAATTYLAPSSYYDEKELALKNILLGVGGRRRGLDIGCGDGRYTRLFSDFCQHVVAYEMSPGLRAKCSELNDKAGIHNITVKNGSLPHLNEEGRFDLITMLGVTSCIISDKYFERSIKLASKLGEKDLIIITIDTLSTSRQDIFNSTQEGYVARYRQICRYQRFFERHGFILTSAIKLLEDKSRGWINRMSIFELK